MAGLQMFTGDQKLAKCRKSQNIPFASCPRRFARVVPYRFSGALRCPWLRSHGAVYAIMQGMGHLRSIAYEWFVCVSSFRTAAGVASGGEPGSVPSASSGHIMTGLTFYRVR